MSLFVLEWNASVSTTYSVKVEPSVLPVVMTGNTRVELRVPYNSPHSVTIVALNCAGYTNTTILKSYIVSTLCVSVAMQDGF